jgi:hypothetical protein
MVEGKRDPGYLDTSRMALESGLCLALQGPELKERGLMQGGVLTPATAMGSVLIDRLRKADITFEIVKSGSGKEHPAKSSPDSLKSSSGAARAGGVASLPPRLCGIAPLATCRHMHAAADTHLHPGLRMIRRHMHAQLSAGREEPKLGGCVHGPQQWLRHVRFHAKATALSVVARAGQIHMHGCSRISSCIDRRASDLLTHG